MRVLIRDIGMGSVVVLIRINLGKARGFAVPGFILYPEYVNIRYIFPRVYRYFYQRRNRRLSFERQKQSCQSINNGVYFTVFHQFLFRFGKIKSL